ncbi:MAG TPA: cob(I)yrinic acid a,c-diamide adenosyltransferase [Syntrophorhabdaceae bacterium]|nr:cob(I)yrinic acid a,c-diamide adenosyltransferase [Syntrophorhabdaceae bacterium]HOG38953.1 cob(I)yrinic acid a,c-diamide adenosyltransferase [Syntrophorhabdaceae bacterium]
MVDDRGLIVVFTGDGKGKTTAALGVALRASGRGMKTLVIQFIKQGGTSGEQTVCPSVVKEIEIYPFGMGFVFHDVERVAHKEAVENAWQFMEKMLEKGKYDILVLDELNVVLHLGLFPVKRVVEFLYKKDSTLHVIITGRGAPSEIVELADIVTEMKQIKHIFNSGVKSAIGIDY